jgi:hypothetical protein
VPLVIARKFGKQACALLKIKRSICAIAFEPPW